MRNAAKKPAVKKPAAKKPAVKSAEKPAKAALKKPAKAASPDKPKVYFAPADPKLGDLPTFPVVNAKCRRGSDRMSEGQNCACLTAENMTTPGSPTVQFRCTKCKYAWRVPLGGAFQGL